VVKIEPGIANGIRRASRDVRMDGFSSWRCYLEAVSKVGVVASDLCPDAVVDDPPVFMTLHPKTCSSLLEITFHE
jgi:hypothetical protein